MVSGVIALYESRNIPCNDAKDVAATMIYAMGNGRSGEALYVSGTKTYELEERLEKARPEWLGQQVYEELMAGQTVLGWVSLSSSPTSEFAAARLYSDQSNRAVTGRSARE